jgi:hypothetical protein
MTSVQASTYSIEHPFLSIRNFEMKLPFHGIPRRKSNYSETRHNVNIFVVRSGRAGGLRFGEIEINEVLFQAGLHGAARRG